MLDIMPTYNLASPNGIAEPVSLNDLQLWFDRELQQLSNRVERTVLKRVAASLPIFIRWPAKSLLLWPDCDRIPPQGKKQKHFSYPPHIRDIAKTRGIRLDRRQNGPAVAAFLFAGGERPKRFGSSNAWSIHHLYSGKFPYVGRERTIHAIKDCRHFTQSAGLIAAHPVADALVDEFPFFAWLLRSEAYLRFGYDPDAVFASRIDEYGFTRKNRCELVSANTARAAAVGQKTLIGFVSIGGNT